MNKLKMLFFPPACVSCGELLPSGIFESGCDKISVMCPSCFAEWNRLEGPRYLRGIEQVPQMFALGGCYDFLSLVPYRSGMAGGVPEKFVYHLKHVGTKRAFEFATRRLCSFVSEFDDIPIKEEDTLVTYMPRRAKAINLYGYDQAKKLAYSFAKGLHLPCKPTISRELFGKEQKTLGSDARGKNAGSSFYLRSDAEDICFGKTVFLMDDLVTTGATIGVGSALLLSAGAVRVIAVSVARTCGENFGRD